MKNSIRATYDSRVTGPRYRLSVQVGRKVLDHNKPINDPFIRTTVKIGLREILSELLRGRSPLVTVLVSADLDLMNDVLELDENTLISGRTRQAAFRQSITEKLRSAGEEG